MSHSGQRQPLRTVLLQGHAAPEDPAPRGGGNLNADRRRDLLTSRRAPKMGFKKAAGVQASS